MMTPTKFDWAETDRMSPSPEQERKIWAREECERRGIDPDEICADGGVEAWMVVAQSTDFECQDCIGMKDHGCYCAAMGAISPGGAV